MTAAALRSFIDVPADHDFPIQNLPYGVISGPHGAAPRAAVRIADFALDLAALHSAGSFAGLALPAAVFAQGSLNAFMSLEPDVHRGVRQRLIDLLKVDGSLRDDAALRGRALLPLDQVRVELPVQIGDYTDFYSSREHATNVGSMFRGPDKALLPNWLWLPVAYHGRSSSVVASGHAVRRPLGQTSKDDTGPPAFGPSRSVDFELEMGMFVGRGNALGSPIRIDSAEQHIFGLALVNDWSARDIQRWEYVPLGPFLAKNFATTVSPWIVPLEALEPFRCAGPAQDPAPLAYLKHPKPARSTFDIHLEVQITTADGRPTTVCCSNFRYLYWSIGQQIAHHTVNGCNLRTGDLLASGTISGPAPDSYGSMLELAWRGERPVTLADGSTRVFIQDGDTVTLRGWAQGEGYRVGFGECAGTLLAAR